jgi:hypothetical protein
MVEFNNKPNFAPMAPRKFSIGMLLCLLFGALSLFAQKEKGLRYELVTGKDTLLLEYRTCSLGWLMIWGKKQTDSTFVSSVSLLIKADEPQKLWKLDHGRQKFSPLLLTDFPSAASGEDWKKVKEEFSKGIYRLQFSEVSGTARIAMDTAQSAPRYFFEFLTWHIPAWKSGFLKLIPTLEAKGTPIEIVIKSLQGKPLAERVLRFLAPIEREADLSYYFIPPLYMETGIPSGNTPGSPIQITPNKENNK